MCQMNAIHLRKNERNGTEKILKIGQYMLLSVVVISPEECFQVLHFFR